MTAQTVQFVNTEVSVLSKYLPNKFEFRRDRGWVWLQRLALWTLKKIGAFAREETKSYKLVTVHEPDFVQALYNQQRELMNSYMLRGERILIGPQEFGELMGRMPPQMFSTLSFEADVKRKTESGYRVMGMKVTIIPWMKGILVVPKDVV